MSESEFYCAICLESLEQENRVTFCECGHMFCRCCVIEWILTDHNTCPLDRKNIGQIKDTLLSGDISLSYREFVRNIVLHHSDLYQGDIENFWCETLEIIWTVLNIYDKNFLHVFQYLSEILEKRKKVEINDIKKAFMKYDINLLMYSSSMMKMKKNSKYQIIYSVIAETENEVLTHFQINVLKWQKIIDLVLQLELAIRNYGFENLLNLDFVTNQNVQAFCELMKNDTNNLKELKTVIKVISLTFIENNNSLYGNIQEPLIVNVNCCLVCNDVIHKISFGKFCHCHHKICISCINKYMITRASCPFHETHFQDLVIFDKTCERREKEVEKKKSMDHLMDYIQQNQFSFVSQTLAFSCNRVLDVFKIFEEEQLLLNINSFMESHKLCLMSSDEESEAEYIFKAATHIAISKSYNNSKIETIVFHIHCILYEKLNLELKYHIKLEHGLLLNNIDRLVTVLDHIGCFEQFFISLINNLNFPGFFMRTWMKDQLTIIGRVQDNVEERSNSFQNVHEVKYDIFNFWSITKNTLHSWRNSEQFQKFTNLLFLHSNFMNPDVGRSQTNDYWYDYQE